MKLLLLGSYAKSLTTFRGPLIKTLVQRGHEVIATAPHLTPPVEDELSALGARTRDVPLDRTGTNPLSDLRYLIAVRRLLREERPDRILAYTMKPVIYGSLAAGRRYHMTSMLTGVGYGFGAGGVKQRVVGALMRRLLRAALASNQVVIFQNPDDRQELLDRGIIDTSTRTAIVNGSGVDIDHYAPRRISSSSTFLMIARLLEDKGVREYAAAARIAKRRYPNARFNLVGGLDSNPRCIPRRELDSWIEEGTINFLGQVDDVRPDLGDCAVYVLPSYREGTPRTNLEAMSMGRAIITTDVPGCRETVVDGRNGWLIPPRDVEALVARMCGFLSGEYSAVEMGQQGRLIAEEKYDVRKVNERILECLNL